MVFNQSEGGIQSSCFLKLFHAPNTPRSFVADLKLGIKIRQLVSISNSTPNVSLSESHKDRND